MVLPLRLERGLALKVLDGYTVTSSDPYSGVSGRFLQLEERIVNGLSSTHRLDTVSLITLGGCCSGKRPWRTVWTTEETGFCFPQSKKPMTHTDLLRTLVCGTVEVLDRRLIGSVWVHVVRHIVRPRKGSSSEFRFTSQSIFRWQE